MSAYPHIFMPITIGNHTLKNRLVMAPIITGLENCGRMIELGEFYARRAKDGVGLVIVGNNIPHISGVQSMKDSVASRTLLTNHQLITLALRKEKTKSLFQIKHYGAAADHPFAISASSYRNSDTSRTALRCPGFLIDTLINSYARTASLAIDVGGYDGIEIAGNGLTLPNTFFSPRTNYRKDKWGKDRMLFALRIVEKIRQSIGNTPLLGYRLSLMDLHNNAPTWPEIIAFSQALIDKGISLFSLDIGYSRNRIPIANELTPPNTWVPFMDQFASEVNCPVIYGKKLGSATDIEQILEHRSNALVEIARPLIADPLWTSKIRQEQEETIDVCVYCKNGCLHKDETGKIQIHCITNPKELLASQLKKETATSSTDVLIVGAGPAGIACALEASNNGFNVTLVDENEEVGGQLLMAAKIPGKEAFSKYLKMQHQRLINAGVNLELGTKVDSTYILSRALSHKIVLATGAEPRFADIPGIDGPNVLNYEDLLKHHLPVGRRVAILGSDDIAKSVARFLTMKSMNPDTAVSDWLKAWGIGTPTQYRGGMYGFVPTMSQPQRTIYMLSDNFLDIDADLKPFNRAYEAQWLRMHGIQTFTDVNFEMIDAYSLRISFGSDHSSPEVLRVDHIILCLGQDPRDELKTVLTSEGFNPECIGAMQYKDGICDASIAVLEGIKTAQLL